MDSEMNKLQVFYRLEMNVTTNTSQIQNAAESGLFVARAGPLIEVISDWTPLTVDEISISPDRAHVLRVLEGVENNGYGNNLQAIADSLPYGSASFYHAAVRALSTGIAMSPSVGFHH